jgi:hypothetical protein
MKAVALVALGSEAVTRVNAPPGDIETRNQDNVPCLFRGGVAVQGESGAGRQGAHGAGGTCCWRAAANAST